MSKNLKKYFLYFLFYSFLGWTYEVILGLVFYNLGFVNRGFLFGPYLPIYGIGSLIFIILLEKSMQNKIKILNINIMPLIVFFIVVLLTTILELISTYIMDVTVGGWLWDYSYEYMNFQGRIALIPSIRFGFGGIIILYIIHPLCKKIINSINSTQFDKLAFILVIIFLLDLCVRPFYGSNFKDINSYGNKVISTKIEKSI